MNKENIFGRLFHKRFPAVKVDPRFKETLYLVEANSYETMALWQDHHDGNPPHWMENVPEGVYKIPWKQDAAGEWIQIGSILGRPITITFFWTILYERYRICFYNACSLLIDKRMVEEYLDDIMRVIGKDIPTTNAMNFQHALSHCRDLAKKDGAPLHR